MILTHAGEYTGLIPAKKCQGSVIGRFDIGELRCLEKGGRLCSLSEERNDLDGRSKGRNDEGSHARYRHRLGR